MRARGGDHPVRGCNQNFFKETFPNSFLNLKIGTRLALGFIVVLLFLAAILGMGVLALGQLQSRMDNLVNDSNVKLAAANTMLDQIRDIYAAAGMVVLVPEEAGKQAQMKQVAEARAKYGAAKVTLDKLVQSEQGKAALAKVETALAEALCQAFGHLHTPEVYAADYRRLCLNLGQTLRITDCSHLQSPERYRRLMDYIRANGLQPDGFSREITLIDYGLTNDTEKFVTEITIPVREA